MKIKLIDNKNWEKIISIKEKSNKIYYPVLGKKTLIFKFFDIKKLPIYRQIE